MDNAIEIEGIDEVATMLHDAPKAVVAGSFLKAAQAAAKPIEQALDAACPVSSVTRWNPETFSEFDDDSGGGQLKAARVTVVTLDADFRGVAVEVGYGKMGHVANFVENGHRMIGHKPDKKEEGQPIPPKPFMQPAAAGSSEQAIDEFAETMVSELKGTVLD